MHEGEYLDALGKLLAVRKRLEGRLFVDGLQSLNVSASGDLDLISCWLQAVDVELKLRDRIPNPPDPPT